MTNILKFFLEMHNCKRPVIIILFILLCTLLLNIELKASDKVYICQDTDGYSGEESKTVYHYDSLNNLLSYKNYQWNGIRYVEDGVGTTYTYDSLSNMLSYETSYNAIAYTYDNQNNLIEKISLNINNGVRTNSNRYVYTYSSQVKISELYENWVSNAWKPNTRTDFFYYQSNQMDSCRISYVMNGLNWQESSKKLFYYHPNDYSDFDSLFTWSIIDSNWVVNAFDSITYDANWRVLENVNYTVNDTVKTPYERFIYTYDTNGNQTTYSEDYWQDPAWLPNFWGHSTYDSNNHLIYSYGSCYGCGYGEGTYSYDIRGRQIHTNSYSVTHGGIENSSECDIYYQEIKGLSSICEGGFTTLSADSGYAGYSWSTGANSRSINIYSAGTYSVSVRDSSGFWDRSAPFRVGVVYAAVAPHATDSSIVLCRNQGIQLRALMNPMYSYQWIYNDDSLVHTFLSGGYAICMLSAATAPSGCYRLVVSSGCDVDTSDRTCIQFAPDSIANISVSGGVYNQYGHLYVCPGDTVTLTASQGSSYLWPHAADSNRSVRIAKAGSYTVYVYSPTGCYSTATISISQQSLYSPLSLIPGDTLLSINPTYNSLYYIITWLLNGDTIPGYHEDTLWNPVDGYYQVIINYPNICPVYSYSNIEYYHKDSLLVSTTGSREVCNGDNYSFSIGANTRIVHGTPPYTYQWSPQIGLYYQNGMYASGYIDSLVPGQTQTYILTVTDSTGKVARDSIFIKVKVKPVKPTFTRSTNDSICPSGQFVEVSLLPYSAQVGNTYTIHRLIGGCYSSMNYGITNLSCAGTYAFQYTLDGCRSALSDSLVVDTFSTGGRPEITVTGNPIFCYGDSVLLQASASNVMSSRWREYNYGYIPNSDSTSIYANFPGSWRYEMTDWRGCTSQSYYKSLDVDTSFHISINSDIPSVICSGDSVRLWFAASTYPNHNMQWMKNGLGIRNANDSVYYATETGNYSLLIYPPATVCAGASQSKLIQIRPLPVVHVLQNNNELEAITQSWNYQWYEDGNLQLNDTNRILQVNSNGIYAVKVTDYHGCSAVAQYVVNCGANLSETNINCFGNCNGSINAVPEGLPPFSFQWSTGDTTSQIQNLCQGNYTLIIHDTLGCIDTISVTITEPLSINAALNIDSAECFGDCAIIQKNVTGGNPPYTYQWCDGSVLPHITLCTNQNCSLIVTDQNGCIDSSVIFDVVIPDSLRVLALNTGTTCIGCNDGFVNLQISGGISPYMISWTPNVGSISSDTIINLSSGYFSISVKDNNQCEFIQTVFVADDPLHVEDNRSLKLADIYPNPVHEKLFIELRISAKLTFFDSYGKLIDLKDAPSGHLEYDISGFAPGIYMLQILAQNNFQFVKVVVQ